MGRIKVERIREKVKAEVARILMTQLNDPRLGFVTITKVDITPDFRDAKVYWSVLGDQAEQRKVARMLDEARGYIQREVAGTLRTRTTPILKFVHDASIEKSIRVAEILQKIKEERGPGAEGPPSELENSSDSGEAVIDSSDDDSSDDDDDSSDDDDEDEDDEDEDEEEAPKPKKKPEPRGRAKGAKGVAKKAKASRDDDDDDQDDDEE